MRSQLTRIDKTRFGPWAIVTGSSSGIGKEFARQLAASGLSLVLVARRLDALEDLGRQLANEFGIEYRAIGLDLSAEDFLERLAKSTRRPRLRVGEHSGQLAFAHGLGPVARG